jgi:hypothetical protein
VDEARLEGRTVISGPNTIEYKIGEIVAEIRDRIGGGLQPARDHRPHRRARFRMVAGRRVPSAPASEAAGPCHFSRP